MPLPPLDLSRRPSSLSRQRPWTAAERWLRLAWLRNLGPRGGPMKGRHHQASSSTGENKFSNMSSKAVRPGRAHLNRFWSGKTNALCDRTCRRRIPAVSQHPTALRQWQGEGRQRAPRAAPLLEHSPIRRADTQPNLKSQLRRQAGRHSGNGRPPSGAPQMLNSCTRLLYVSATKRTDPYTANECG